MITVTTSPFVAEDGENSILLNVGGVVSGVVEVTLKIYGLLVDVKDSESILPAMSCINTAPTYQSPLIANSFMVISLL